MKQIIARSGLTTPPSGEPVSEAFHCPSSITAACNHCRSNFKDLGGHLSPPSSKSSVSLGQSCRSGSQCRHLRHIPSSYQRFFYYLHRLLRHFALVGNHRNCSGSWPQRSARRQLILHACWNPTLDTGWWVPLAVGGYLAGVATFSECTPFVLVALVSTFLAFRSCSICPRKPSTPSRSMFSMVTPSVIDLPPFSMYFCSMPATEHRAGRRGHTKHGTHGS